jgi:hypothetical protein
LDFPETGVHISCPVLGCPYSASTRYLM